MSVSILRNQSSWKRKAKTVFAMLVKPFSMLLLLSGLLSLSTFAQGYATVDFHQAENDRTANKTYDISWVNGILNATHTDYFEGMGVPQRLVFTGILPKSAGSPTARNTHSLIFQVLAEKAAKHAYDFPISWEQAFQTAARIGNGSVNELPHLLPGAGTQQCGDAFSAQGRTACDALSVSSLPASQIARPSFPDVIGNPGKPTLGTPNVNDNIICFEGSAGYGDRTLEIRGNKEISNPSISFDGYKGSGRDYAQYTITWTSESDQIMIRFATRLSPGAGQCGYGSGQGAGSISGGPYHVVLNTIDGVSLGSQDNQIMSNAIQIPPNCAIIAPADACAGAGNVTFNVTPVTGETYTWSITNVSGANPTPLSGTGSSFVVNVGSTAGTFDVNLTVTSPAGVTSCLQPYRVYPPVVTNAGPDQTVCSSSPDVTLAGSVSGGATTGTWSSSGTGSFSPDANTLNAVYTPSAADITAGTVTLTLTSANPDGPCEATTDNMVVTINPPVVTNAGPDQTVCSSSPDVTLAGSVSGGATTGTWSSSGTGSFSPDANTLNAVYTPSAADITAGTVTLTLTSANPDGPCEATTDQMTIFISPRPGKPSAVVLLPLCTDQFMTVEVTLPSGLSSSATVTLKQMTGGHAPITVNASTAVGGKLTFTGLTFGKGYSVTILDNVSTANPDGCTSLPEVCGTFTDGGQTVVNSGRLTEQEIVLNSEPKTKVLAAPNPFNDRIRFTLKSEVTGRGSLELYNFLGQKVRTVFQGQVNAGQVQTIEYAVPVQQRFNLIYVFRVGNEQTSGKLIGPK